MRATDSTGAYSQCTVSLLLTSAPPVFSGSCLDTIFGYVGHTAHYYFEATDPDTCDTLTYSILSVSPTQNGTLVIDPATGVLAFTPASADLGATYAITVHVSDGYASETCRVWVQVLPPQPPVMAPSLCGDTISTSHCKSIPYVFEAIDPDADSVPSYLFYASVGTIDSANGEWLLAYPGVDYVSALISVVDDDGLADSCVFTVHFEDTTPEIFGFCGDTMVAIPELPLTVDFASHDPDSCDQLKWSLQSITPTPAGSVAVDSTTGQFNFVPTTADLNKHFQGSLRLTDEISFDVCNIIVSVENVTPCPCGDVNRDIIVNVSDVIALIAYIFSGGPSPTPVEIGDVDCNKLINISDVVHLIGFVFAGSTAPCDTDNDGISECAISATDCLVFIFGAGSICKGCVETYELIEFPLGGTYLWTITAGSDYAAI